MSELTVLRALLISSMAIGPLGAHRVLLGATSRLRVAAYVAALACAAVGLFSTAPILCAVWLLFCAASFALFLRSRASTLRSARTLAAAVPFLFSNVAAVWLVAGANDLHLLGYDRAFSFYAALHGNVLGWITLGAIAILADRDGPQQRLYLASVLVCFVSFLLVAVGIDRLRAIKPIGVVGLTLAIPSAQLAFLWSVRRRPAALVLGGLSLAGLVFTMVLAWRNELSMPWLLEIAGVRAMVSVHGVLNALVVGPCLLWAVSIRPRS